MKRKHNKKTGIIAAVVGLSSVALVSVGFASWIISDGDSTEVTGNISVDSAEDHRFAIDKSDQKKPAVSYYYVDGTEKTGTSIIYGAPHGTTTNGWLKNNSADDSKECLNARIVYYVANIDGLTKGTDYILGATVVAVNKKDKFDIAAGHSLVELPTITVDSFAVENSTSYSIGDTAYTKVTLTLNFKWGSYFQMTHEVNNQQVTENVNPYVWYNTGHNVNDILTGTTTYGDDALAKLDEIHDFNGATFKVTLTTSIPQS